MKTQKLVVKWVFPNSDGSHTVTLMSGNIREIKVPRCYGIPMAADILTVTVPEVVGLKQCNPGHGE